MIWDEENRLACSHENVQSQTLPQTPASCDNAGGTPNAARYLYDDAGTRVVKDGAQFHLYPNRNYSTRGNQEFKHIYVGEAKLLTKLVEPSNRVEDRKFYSHPDHLGSTGFVTDDSGGLAEHLAYFPGGETWVSEHPSQPVPHQFTGKELDPETGLYYMGARYYDPRTQVWQSPDPALPDSVDGSLELSAYLYGAANPLSYDDPDGRQVRKRVQTPDPEKLGDEIVLPPPAPDNYIDWAGAAQSQAAYYGDWSRMLPSSPSAVAMGSIGLALPISQAIPGFSPTPDDVSAGIIVGGGFLLAGWLWLTSSMSTTQTTTIATTRAVPRTRTQSPPLLYVTYTKYNDTTGETYVGRATGYGTPQQVVAQRDRGHHKWAQGFGPAQPDVAAPATKSYKRKGRDPAYWAIRGREQMLIDFFGGSWREKGRGNTRSGNDIRGVRKNNKMGRIYDAAAAAAFGRIAPYTGR